jgi:phosphoribosylanthranilate isomerase
MIRPLVKICGVTRPEDAERAVALGAALIGVNFHPPSPRCVTVERAAEIVAAVAGRALVAGVFVDLPPARVAEIAEGAGLDLLQFHGDEPRAEVAAWGERAIRVHRLSAEGEAAGGGTPGPALLALYPRAWGFLFDLRHPELAGGSGASWAWSALHALATSVPGRRVLVAGGVHPGNAARALAASGASGVDVCSGVESAPGIKDPVLLARLFAEVFDGESATRS